MRVRVILARCGGLLRRKRADQDLNEEVQFHLQSETDSLIRNGLTSEEARYMALKKFGNVGLTKDLYRETGKLQFIETCLRELRLAFRTLRKNPGFTTVAMLTLAVGIGANTAIFTVADPLLLQSLPVRDADELVLLRSYPRDRPSTDYVPYGLFDSLRSGSESFSGVFAQNSSPERLSMAIEGYADSVDVRTAWVSGAYFEALGVSARVGRLFAEPEDVYDSGPVAVVSDRFWRLLFGSDPDIIGKTGVLTVPPAGEFQFAIVGVAEAGFGGVNADFNADVWLPLHHHQLVRMAARSAPDLVSVQMMARLRPGAGVERAQAEVDVINQQISAEDPTPVIVEHGALGYSNLRDEYRESLLVLIVATGTLLLIACANLAALLLSRGRTRRREVAIRLAIGSGRSGVVRHLLIEGLVLAGLGGILGTVFASWGARLLAAYLPPESGFLPSPGTDLRVLAFATTVTLVSVAVFALIPALRTSGLDLNSVMKEGAGRDATGFRRAFSHNLIVSGQSSFAIVLLVGAGLLLGTFRNLTTLDTGFDQDDVIQFSVRTNSAGGRSDVGDSLLPRLDNLSGIESATYYFYGGLLSNAGSPEPIEVMGSAASTEGLSAEVFQVGPKFFRTMGISILEGRDFVPGDRDREPDPLSVLLQTDDAESGVAAPVGVISENMADSLFPDQNPIGQMIRDGTVEVEIVGVAENTRYNGLREQPPWMLYRLSQTASSYLNVFALRTELGPEVLAPSLQSLVSETDGDYYVTEVKTIREVVESVLVRERFVAWLAGLFGALALFLTSLGLHGLVSYGVAQRTGEIGIRMALGAQTADILRMLTRETIPVVATGIVAGLAGAWATTQLITKLLFGVTPTDPETITAAVITLILGGLAACSLPAWRASRIDPLVALRHE